MHMMPLLVLLQALSTGGIPAAPTSTDDAQAIVDRLGHDLVCLCGKCDRLLLAECTCDEAMKERANLMRDVSAQDLTTAEARTRAYETARDRYVARFGKKALAASPGMSIEGWVYLAWVGALFAGGGILLFRWRHWRPRAFSRVRRRSGPPRGRRR